MSMLPLSLQRNFKLIMAAAGLRFSEFQRIISLAWLYQRLDIQLEKLRRRTKIFCPRGCGHCCENPFVETTVLEMMPLANTLMRENKGQSLDRFLTIPVTTEGFKKCPFYIGNPNHKGYGRCSVYDLRPLVCRLYGYSALKDKYQKKHFQTCQKIKSVYPNEYKAASLNVELLPFPDADEYNIRRLAITGPLDDQLYPLSIALKMAIEQIGLQSQIKKDE